jgi:hypothetical protein
VVDDVIGPNGENVIGAQGEPGIAGARGAAGVNGANGANGATGARGIQGLAGNAGTNGVNGAVGAKGDAGVKGATGAQGLSGDAGADGAAGAQGIQGLAGADSIVAGADGADGIMYDGAFEGDMQYWNGNAWMMITAPDENAGSLSFCDGQPTWTQGECPVFYEVGDVGPAGGWVFHISDGGLHGLEAAPVDQGVDQDGGYGAEWGCYGETVPGTFGTAVGTGQANTALIVAHTCSINPQYGGNAHEAANLAIAYSVNGYADWFLPSEDEAELMYRNLQVNDIGGFAGGGRAYYWSSTERNDFAASVIFMGPGTRSRHGLIKAEDRIRVRAARAF